MPSELGKKGLDMGLITKRQYEKLPPHLVDAIVKKKMGDKKPTKKGGKKNGGKKGGKKYGK